MANRDRRNATFDLGDCLMPWERDDQEGGYHEPTFHSAEPVVRVLLLDQRGYPLLVEEPEPLGFDPTRIRR